MSLPDLSFMMTVGQYRYLQSRFERGELRNPDTHVGGLLSLREKLRCYVKGCFFMQRVRANPFYYYVLARTRHYDRVFAEALGRRCAAIVNIGCGSDTRSMRFAQQAKQVGAVIYECDQAEAIAAKEQVMQRRWPVEHVRFRPIDLNVDGGDVVDGILQQHAGRDVLVMLEGVSPYVDTRAFTEFLQRLARRMTPGSRIAYDFKSVGSAVTLGVTERVQQPFRLGPAEHDVRHFHTSQGLQVELFAHGADLQAKALEARGGSGGPLFREDSLVVLSPMASTSAR